MKKIRSVKVWTSGWEEMNQSLEDLFVLYDFYEAEEVSEQEISDQFNQTLSLIEQLEAKNMLRQEEDKLGAVLKINAGAGGY